MTEFYDEVVRTRTILISTDVHNLFVACEYPLEYISTGLDDIGDLKSLISQANNKDVEELQDVISIIEDTFHNNEAEVIKLVRGVN